MQCYVSWKPQSLSIVSPELWVAHALLATFNGILYPIHFCSFRCTVYIHDVLIGQETKLMGELRSLIVILSSLQVEKIGV